MRQHLPHPAAQSVGLAALSARLAAAAALIVIAAGAGTPVQATHVVILPQFTVGESWQAARAAVGPAARRKAACPAPRAGYEGCFALYAPQLAVNAAIAAGARGPGATPSGWGARAIESAYRLPVSLASDQTVAVSVAFSTPHLAQDLAVYRTEFGLPACTEASGCLREVNQAGQPGPLPASGVPFGWDVETTLDVSMISAACPHCKILVVEASSPSIAGLAASEAIAARLGAQVISNSYGTRENGYVQAFAKYYRQPGHTIVVSSGDFGFGAANFPANLASVTAVGGTELTRAHDHRRWSERVWSSPEGGAAASGCSAYVAKPAWQHDPHCGMRTVADVAAVAAGVAIYDKLQGGWLTIDGTSIAAPLIAGIYGLAGNAAKIAPGYLYRHARSLFDINVGSNVVGDTCGGDYLCVAKPSYDAPTGLGTPDGTGAF